MAPCEGLHSGSIFFNVTREYILNEKVPMVCYILVWEVSYARASELVVKMFVVLIFSFFLLFKLQQEHPSSSTLFLLLNLHCYHLHSLAELWSLNHAFTLEPLNNPSSVPFTSLSNYGDAQAFLAVQGPKDSNAPFTIEPYLAFVSFDGNRTFYLCVYVIVYTLTGDGFIVWTANRNSPIVGQNATLALLDTGDLQLRSGDGTLAWSSGTAGMNVQTMKLTLSPAGLVLYNAINGVVWQSVDHPTDTLTANQILTQGMKLVSWKSPTDPSNGSYSLVMEPGGLALYDSFFSEPQPYWIWGFFGLNDSFSVTHRCNSLIEAKLTTYDSLTLSDTKIPVNMSDNLSLPRLCAIQNETGGNPVQQLQKFADYASGTASTHADSTFLRLGSDGKLGAYYLSTTVEVSTFDALNDICLLPRACGSYGLCSSGTCSGCPDGFVPNDNSDPSKGCDPDPPVDCESGNTFMRITGIDYFSTRYLAGQDLPTEQSCQGNCSQNCSCLAALWHDLNKTCFLIADKIGSLEKVDQGSYVAYLKVGYVRGKGSKSRLPTIIAATSTSVVPVLLVFCCLCFLVRRKFVGRTEEEEDAFLDAIPGLPTRFSYNELQAVTNGFARTLGKGGFGTVYEGVLADGTRVAVKQLEGMRQGDKEFRSEVAIMGAIHHFNILRLLGFCVQGNHRLLVYEYMENGSLDQWLFDNPHPLSWEVRCKIALGAARGLAYLHDDCRERIVHLDVKPQNILLDEEFVPKVADMGLSRLIGRAEAPQVATTMRGTPGYLAPEWMKLGVIDTKCDVFSFGMLLMEIVSGRKNLQLELHGEQVERERVYYPEWAFKRLLLLLGGDEEGVRDLTDVKLEEEEEEEQLGQLRRMLSIAFLCVVEDPAARPSMERVVQMLEGREAVLDSEGQHQLGKLRGQLEFVLRHCKAASSSSPSPKRSWSLSKLNFDCTTSSLSKRSWSGRPSNSMSGPSSSSTPITSTEMASLSIAL